MFRLGYRRFRCDVACRCGLFLALRKHEGFDIVEINRFCRETLGRLNRRRGNGLRQGAVGYAQPVEHAHSTIGQIPAMAQEAARPDRKAWDQFGPFLPG